MNERIRQLAEQARNYALDEKRIYERVNNTEQCMEEYREVYNKKFAELIVRECAEVGLDSVEDGDDLDAIMKRVHNNILKHFGVAE
jgi:DNA integrity scanning protein DisA with diadenylate cyclase activity